MDACDEIVGWQNVAAFVLFNQNAPGLVGANRDFVHKIFQIVGKNLGKSWVCNLGIFKP